MSSGSLTVIVPHFCGCPINVTINWSSHPGTYWEPPDYDEDWQYGFEHYDEPVERCPGCGVKLDYDDLFQANVIKARDNAPDQGEYDDGPDYEPDLDPPEQGWDDVWEKIDPRYN